MEKTFENMDKTDAFTLETDEGPINDFYPGDIANAIEEIIDYGDGFVILTAPEAKEKIRYIQCAVLKDGSLTLQLGIEEKRTRLVEKTCSEEELKEIFLDFYDGCFKPDLSEYKPVQFK